MAKIPRIQTWRLKLRPFQAEDAGAVQRLLSDPEITANMPGLAHPYVEGTAERWIAGHAQRAFKDEGLVLAITQRETDELIGVIELRLDRMNGRASLGFSIGKAHRSNGYCTEAARAMLRLAFTHLSLNRVSGSHVVGNTASGKVLQKIGMTREGVRRQHVKRGDTFVDVVEYGIVRTEMPESILTASFMCFYGEPRPVEVPA